MPVLLHEFDLPRKILVTMFLVSLSSGFFVAHLYLNYTMAKAEGGEERWVPSTQAIVKHFHGEPDKTRLKTMCLGPMKTYFQRDDEERKPVTLDAEEQADLDALLDWNDRGAPEDEYWDPQDHSQYRTIYKILSMNRCLDCHTRSPMRDDGKADAPLDTYADIKKYTIPDRGLSKGTLLMLSHVHLLGMSLMMLGAAVPVMWSRYSGRVRGGLAFAGFFSILLDIGGWWAVKGGGAAWVWMVLAGGLLMGIAFGLMVLLALVDMWRTSR